MGEVIRAAFRKRHKPAAPIAGARIDSFTTLRGYGSAGGHKVGLARVDEGENLTSLRVHIGPNGGRAATTVVILPDTAEGETTAELVAFAILRAFHVASVPPPG